MSLLHLPLSTSLLTPSPSPSPSHARARAVRSANGLHSEKLPRDYVTESERLLPACEATSKPDVCTHTQRKTFSKKKIYFQNLYSFKRYMYVRHIHVHTRKWSIDTCTCTLYMYMHVLMRDEKEGRKKQARCTCS